MAVISRARLEKIVALGDILERGIEATSAFLRPQSIRCADTMAIYDLSADRCDDIGALVGNHDGLTSHRACLIRSGTRLHNLLQMRGQVNHGTASR